MNCHQQLNETNMIEPITVKITPQEESIHIEKRDFVPCGELFPKWELDECRSILTSFCERTGSWEITCTWSTVEINLKYPLTYFPRVTAKKVEIILNQLQNDYIPNLDRFLDLGITSYIKGVVLDAIRDHEQRIINCGGRSVLDELKFRLGVSSFCVDDVSFVATFKL